jgi:manganese transport protein
MEGFLSIRMRPWLRRLTTRLAAITPAALTIYIAGEQGTYQLLILSQVILSLQLPFAVIPLIHFTNDRQRMGAFANPGWVRLLSWLVAVIILGLNLRLAWLAVSDWMEAAGRYRPLVMLIVAPLLVGLLALLLWITLQPWLARRRKPTEAVALPEPAAGGLTVPAYRTILVPLDHSVRDRAAIAHAAGMAKLYNAKLYLLHVEEDATSQVYGAEASTAEVEAGARYLEEILESLRAQGIDVEVAVGFSRDPKEEIVRFARQVKPDLVVMGAHGHKGIQDLVFGQTINGVRHALDTPILIVRDPKPPAGSE